MSPCRSVQWPPFASQLLRHSDRHVTLPAEIRQPRAGPSCCTRRGTLTSASSVAGTTGSSGNGTAAAKPDAIASQAAMGPAIDRPRHATATPAARHASAAIAHKSTGLSHRTRACTPRKSAHAVGAHNLPRSQSARTSSTSASKHPRGRLLTDRAQLKKSPDFRGKSAAVVRSTRLVRLRSGSWLPGSTAARG